MKKKLLLLALRIKRPRIMYCSLISFMLLGSCTTLESFTAPNPNEMPPDGIIQLNFDAEVVAYQVLQNPDKATFLERNAAQARASRSKVSVNIYDDGTAEWRMEKLIPKHDVSIAHQTPANTMPQTKVSRINRSGMGFFYDANGKLLHQDEVKMMSLVDLVARVKKNPNEIYSLAGAKAVGNLQQVIQEAKDAGAVVENLSGGLISIRSVPYSKASSAKISGAEDKYISENIFNKELNILVKSTLYDKSNTMLSRTIYVYKLDDNKKLIPDANYSEIWDKDTKGVLQKTISNIYFNNLSASINFQK